MRVTRTALVPAAVLGIALVAGCGPSSSSAGSSSGSGGSSTASHVAAGSSASSSAANAAASCPTSNTRSFAKTRFAGDVGLAIGTFHRYLYKPYRAGSFTKGANGRIKALLKGGTTAALDVRLLHNAQEISKPTPPCAQSCTRRWRMPSRNWTPSKATSSTVMSANSPRPTVCSRVSYPAATPTVWASKKALTPAPATPVNSPRAPKPRSHHVRVTMVTRTNEPTLSLLGP